MNPNDITWMDQAWALAQQTTADDIPIAALVVRENQIVAQATNACVSKCDPSAHAEILALRQAAKHTNNYRLTDCTVYVTLEPCLMCMGALIHARVERLVFGAYDNKLGAVVKLLEGLQLNHTLNHSLTWRGGVLADQCGQLIKDFFLKRRLNKKEG